VSAFIDHAKADIERAQARVGSTRESTPSHDGLVMSTRDGAARGRDESVRARWCAVYGAAVARMVGTLCTRDALTLAHDNAAWVSIVSDARAEADAAAHAWAMLDATADASRGEP